MRSKLTLQQITRCVTIAVSSYVCAELANAQSTFGTWTLKMPLTAPRTEVAALAIDSKLHAIGGSGNGNAGPYHDEYDPVTDAWGPRAPLPQGRDHLALAVSGGTIFAFGGFVGSVHKDAGSGAFQYDPATKALPTPRSGLAGAYYHGMILVLGGELPPDRTFGENEGYDPKTDGWITLTPMPHGRHGFC